MNPFSGHLIDLKDAALPAGYDRVPRALEREAAAALAGKSEAHINLGKRTTLAVWAKKKRLEKIAAKSRRRNRNGKR